MAEARNLLGLNKQDPARNNSATEAFLIEVRNDYTLEKGHWESAEAIDLEVGGTCSRATYENYRKCLDPNLEQKHKLATAWCCIRDVGYDYDYGCLTCKCGVPDRFIYFLLTMFVCAIAFMLEVDVIALVYFIQGGSLTSENEVEAYMSLYSLLSMSIVYFFLFLTIDQCTKCWWCNVRDKGMRRHERADSESCAACMCPVMNLGGADEDVKFPSVAARLLNIRLRWWMLVPCSRMLFIVVIFGNIDFKTAETKTVDRIRTDKLLTIKGITTIGIVNTLTLTVPNILISLRRVLYEEPNPLDHVFLYCNIVSLSFTIISMCFGVLHAVVTKIDIMDKILTDLTMAEHQQSVVAQYANSHLNDLYNLLHLIYKGIRACKHIKSDSKLDLEQIGAELSTWNRLEGALGDFVPEDKVMFKSKKHTIALLKEMDKITEDVDESVVDKYVLCATKIKLSILKMRGRIEGTMYKYASDLKTACNITGLSFKKFAKKYVKFLECHEREKQHALRTMARYNQDNIPEFKDEHCYESWPFEG